MGAASGMRGSFAALEDDGEEQATAEAREDAGLSTARHKDKGVTLRSR